VIQRWINRNPKNFYTNTN